MNKKVYLIGNIYTNNRGNTCTLIERISIGKWRAVTINGFEFEVHQSQLLKGEFKTPECKSVYDIGYVGVGNYTCRNNSGKVTIEYSTWANMIRRCYTNYAGNKSANSYTSCTVDESWHNFQTFAEWFTSKSKAYLQRGLVPKLDKDLLSNSKVYSENNCVLLPNIINCSLSSSRMTSKFQHGITLQRGIFYATIMYKGRNLHLGTFLTEQEAIHTYNRKKAELLKELSEDFKDVLDPRAYSILQNWRTNE